MATRSIPHRVVQARLDGDLQLGADPVGGGDQQRVDEPRRLQVEQGAEPAQRSLRTGAPRGFGQRFDRLDQGLARVDIYACVSIGEAVRPRVIGGGHGSA